MYAPPLQVLKDGPGTPGRADTPGVDPDAADRSPDERWIRCAACTAPLARPADRFAMPGHGPVASFVNPAGYVHEVMTVTAAPGAVWAGPRVPADSWFPGYTWRFGVCAVCEGFIGWYYEALAATPPATFWGLRVPAVREG